MEKYYKYILNFLIISIVVSLGICILSFLYIIMVILVEILSPLIGIDAGIFNTITDYIAQSLKRRDLKITDILLVFGIVGALVNTLYLHYSTIIKEMKTKSALDCIVKVKPVTNNTKLIDLGIIISNTGQTSNIKIEKWEFESNDEAEFFATNIKALDWPNIMGVGQSEAMWLEIAKESVSDVKFKILCKPDYIDRDKSNNGWLVWCYHLKGNRVYKIDKDRYDVK